MTQSEKGYEFFDHTADIGLRVSGATLPELFTHAARGIIELLAEDSRIALTDARPVRLTAPSVEGLLHGWLTELLFWFDSERFLPAVFDLQMVTETELRGQVRGGRFDPQRHVAGVEVKGVTRHAFSVTRVHQHWEASLILDV